MLRSLARPFLRAAQRLVPARADGFWVLAYHLVDGGTDSPVDISSERFRADLEFVLASCTASSLEDAIAAPPAQRPRVVITFDDAFRNFSDLAWPILEEMKVPVTLYVPVLFLQGKEPSPLSGADLPVIETERLRELAAHELLSVGSHAWRHLDVRTMSPEVRARELVDSRSYLEECLGHSVPSFCYPQAMWSAGTEEEVSRSYENAVIAGGRKNGLGTNPYRISRVPIRRDSAPLPELLSRDILLEEWLADRVRRSLPHD